MTAQSKEEVPPSVKEARMKRIKKVIGVLKMIVSLNLTAWLMMIPAR